MLTFHRLRILVWLKWDSSSFFEWLARRPWYIQILTDWVATIPIEAGDQALEVGSGPGLLTGLLRAQGVKVSGLDRSSAMVERARRSLPECTFVEGDALDIPLETGSMDVAFAASVVNVVSSPELLLRELARVVRPGGRVSVLFPTPRLSDHANQIARDQNITGLSAAALATWGSKAAKLEPAVVQSLFEAADLDEIRVEHFFDSSVASVTGLVV